LQFGLGQLVGGAVHHLTNRLCSRLQMPAYQA
jgi:hypothetical protein